MGKIMVFVVSENEEEFFEDIQKYLQSKTDFIDTSFSKNMTLSFQDLEIDLYHREVRQNKTVIKFTDLEFRLFLYLARQPGRVFTYQQIYEEVWGEEYACEKGIIMTHIRHIRKKLKSDDKDREFIENIRGVGYRFKKQ